MGREAYLVSVFPTVGYSYPAATPRRHGPAPALRLRRLLTAGRIPRPVVDDNSVHREHIDGAAGRHVGIPAREGLVQPALHAGGIDAPAGLHGNVLLAIDFKRHGNAVDARDRGVLPQDLSSLRVEGAEQAVVGAAGEQHVTTGREDRPPVFRWQVG